MSDSFHRGTIFTAMRFFSGELERAVDNHANISDNRSRLDDVKTIIPGVCIIVYISMLERIITDLVSPTAAAVPNTPSQINLTNVGTWTKKLGCQLSAFGSKELKILIHLRNCFAHQYGRATGPKQVTELQAFVQELAAGDVKDWDNRDVGPYFEMRYDNTITLAPEATQRSRLLCLHILKQIGFA